jgi:Protein of unknown function (DUF2844)
MALVSSSPNIGHASLGGDVTSIETDRVHMKATVRVSAAAQYSVHEMQTPYGTSVREFVSPGGVVFAVTWRGPFLPDLRQTLGAYFPIFESAPRPGRFGHAHLAVERSDLVVRSSGRPRSYSGLAYAPQLVPAGVAVDQLQ